jgi:hypothetical protein
MTYPNPELAEIVALVTRYIRAPAEYGDDNGPFLRFDPPLTSEEQARLDRLRAFLRSAVRVTPEEWDTLVPVIDTLRTHRTRTNTDWSAMTAAQRDTALIDWNRALTDVLRALLRD